MPSRPWTVSGAVTGSAAGGSSATASSVASGADPSAACSRIAEDSPMRGARSRAGEPAPADEDLPRVVGVEGALVAANPPGEAQHRRDVVGRRVVVEERAPVRARRPVGVQVVGGAEDRVVGVADVSAEAVGAPGGGHELHRPAGAGGALVAQPSEAGLDEVDRGQYLPADAEAPLGARVVRPQLRGRRGLGGADPRVAVAGGRDGEQLTAGAARGGGPPPPRAGGALLYPAAPRAAA